MENHWWQCFLQNKTKRIYNWFDFYSEISKLLRFVIFPKLVKIDIFNEKQNKHNSKCRRPILLQFSDFYFNFYIFLRLKFTKKQKKV